MKTTKRVLSLVLCVVMLLSMGLIASADSDDAGITVQVNGVAVAWADVKPFIDANSRTMVPLRAVADAMGLDVDWDGEARVASFSQGSKAIHFTIDSPTAQTSEGDNVEMDTAAVIVEDRTYAPIRYLAEYFGYEVGWDGETRTVSLNAAPAPDADPVPDTDAEPDAGQTPDTEPDADTEPEPDADPGADSKQPEPEEQGPAVPTAEELYARMTAKKDEYPEGMRWDNDNYYAWNGGIYSGGYGCAGFAFLLSDAAFGDLPARKVTPSLDTVRVGDILRINGDTHSVIVLEVKADGVVIAEGNYNNSIHWGRTLTAAQVNNATYMITRYPA